MGDTIVRTGRREQGPFGGGTGQEGGHSPMRRKANGTDHALGPNHLGSTP